MKTRQNTLKQFEKMNSLLGTNRKIYFTRQERLLLPKSQQVWLSESLKRRNKINNPNSGIYYTLNKPVGVSITEV